MTIIFDSLNVEITKIRNYRFAIFSVVFFLNFDFVKFIYFQLGKFHNLEVRLFDIYAYLFVLSI